MRPIAGDARPLLGRGQATVPLGLALGAQGALLELCQPLAPEPRPVAGEPDAAPDQHPERDLDAGDAKQGLVALERSGIGEGSLLPHEILVAGRTSPERVAPDLRTVSGIHGEVAPAGPSWRRDGTAIVEAVPAPAAGSSAGDDTLADVRKASHAAGPQVRVGGQPAANHDFIDAVYGSFPLMIR
jgi:hypothetical protein